LLLMALKGNIQMQPEEFRLLKEFSAAEFGLVLSEGKEQYLALKLLPRLEALGLTSFTDYHLHLKFGINAAEEHLRFISLITNNETYFFRENSQLAVLSESVLPALREQKLARGERKVRILSAGCSSGEEVFTLAMLVLESALFLWEWDVEIVGVDIDPEIVQRAVAGIYSGRAFQTMPDYFRERYFTPGTEGLQVRDVLRRMVSFRQGNLLSIDRQFPAGSIDIIFCRNVLIYFDDDTIARIVNHFERLLTPEGLLFLGHSESLSRITSRYVPVCYPGTIVYRREGHNHDRQ
jgi:chemotaxis protein methyltransferase CheR